MSVHKLHRNPQWNPVALGVRRALETPIGLRPLSLKWRPIVEFVQTRGMYRFGAYLRLKDDYNADHWVGWSNVYVIGWLRAWFQARKLTKKRAGIRAANAPIRS